MKRIKHAVWSAALCLVSACGTGSETSSPRVFNGAWASLGNPDEMSPFAHTSLVYLPNGCSGVLVGWNRVLTAKHCFGNYRMVNGEKIFQGSYRNQAVASVKFSSRPDKGARSLPVVQASVRLHDALDLAYFDIRGSLPHGYRPVPIWNEALRLRKGDRLVIAGFGYPREKTNQETFEPILRFGKVRYTGKFLESYKYPSGDIYRSLIELKSVEGGQGSCPGDSGGAAFAWSHGQWGLVGIISGGTCTQVLKAQDTLIADARQPSVRQWYRN